MENPRVLILNRIRQNTNNIIIDELEHNNNNYILSSVIDGIYYTLIDYIQLERRNRLTRVNRRNREIAINSLQELINNRILRNSGRSRVRDRIEINTNRNNENNNRMLCSCIIC